jgi:hypothetical protein
MRILLDTAESLWKVFLIGLVLGAGLPAIFAVGVRLLSPELARSGGVERPGGAAIRLVVGWMALLLVVVSIAAGILYVMKDFLAQTFGLHLF